MTQTNDYLTTLDINHHLYFIIKYKFKIHIGRDNLRINYPTCLEITLSYTHIDFYKIFYQILFNILS